MDATQHIKNATGLSIRLTPMQHMAKIKREKGEKMRELAKLDNKDYSPFPINATASIVDENTPMGSNPFMEF